MKFLFRFGAAAVCVLPLLATSRCVSEAELPAFTLPPATQTGANTLGFVLDGRVWRDYGTSCAGAGRCDSNRARVTHRDPRTGEIDIYAGLTTKEHSEYFYLYLFRIRQPATYPWLSPGSTLSGALLSFNADNGTTSYLSRPGRNGITITRLDTVQRVISGTFAGVLKQQADTTKTVTITDGRFDLKY